MEIKELYSLIQAINDLTTQNGYKALINQLRTAIGQYKTLKAVQSLSPSQIQQMATAQINIESNRIQALSALNEIQRVLSEYKFVKTFNKLKIDNPFGDYANELLRRIPIELESSYESLLTEITQYYQKLNSYQQFTNSLSVVLGDVEEKSGDKEDELIIFFEGGATVENLKELARVSTDWNQIVNCFGRLVKENDTDIHIVSIERGSLIATLSISAAIIHGLIKGSDKILDLIMKTCELRKKALELKEMKLENIAKAIEILEKQSTLNLSSEAKNVARELMIEYGWEQGADLFHETEAATVKAVKKIIKFQNAGGKIDSKLLEPTAEQVETSARLQKKNIEFLKIGQEVANLAEGKQILLIEEGEMEDENE